MIRRRRGLVAQLKKVGGRAGRLQRQAAEPSYPVRALPDKIEFVEEFHYSLSVRGHSFYGPDPTKTIGEIQVDLPFDQMGQEALADAEVHTSRTPGEILARYGWLALTNTVKTDIGTRFDRVRLWREPDYRAFPLVSPLLSADTERLEERVESGWVEREKLFYTPKAPVPFPFEFNLFLGRDSAVPTVPRPGDVDPSYELPTPNGATGQELALHVRLTLNLKRPPGVKEEALDIRIDRLHVNWPTHIVTSQLRLQDAPGGRLWVDSRFNQVVVENVPVKLTSTGSGPLQAAVMFRIVVLQPTTLQNIKPMRGKLKVGVLGMPLSGVRAQYFDAAGYLANENPAGKNLLSYRTELHAEFEYDPASDLRDSPSLLERRYSWAGSEGVSNPFREVADTLKERGFVVDPTLSHGGADRKQRWWATRITDGRELVLDLEMERGEQPKGILGTVSGDQRDRFAIADSPFRTYFTLTIRAYYPGAWEEAAQQMSWLEERLRQRLYLRRQRH